MSKIEYAKGTCLCKKVTITVKDVENKFGVCHCDTCKVWTGGPQMAIGCGQKVEIEGSNYIKSYSSSDWAERGFCTECGTHLFYKLKGKNDYRILLGLFKDTISPKFDVQFFIDKKPKYYSFSEKTRSLTKKEIMTLFGEK